MFHPDDKVKLPIKKNLARGEKTKFFYFSFRPHMNLMSSISSPN